MSDAARQKVVETGASRSSRDAFAAELRGFGPIGIVAILIIVPAGSTVFVGTMVPLPIGPVLVLIWAWLSRTPWREIGYVAPRSWFRTLALGVTFGVALKFLMKAIVMPLLGADPINQPYHFLAGNRDMLPVAIWAMINAGFAEETMVRGYYFERLGKLLGSSVGAKTIIVLVTSAMFGYSHYGVQGLAGAQQGAIVGLVFGTIFAMTGRLVTLMVAHAAFDLTALALIYWNLESNVARLIFR